MLQPRPESWILPFQFNFLVRTNANGRLEGRWPRPKLCWNVDLCALLFELWTLNYLCSLHGNNCVWHLFHQSKHKAVVTFLLFPHVTRRRIQAWGPTTGAIRDARPRPCTAEPLRGAKRCSGRITRRRFGPWTTSRASWSSRESWQRRGRKSFGWRWRSWTFHQGYFVSPRSEA